MLCVLKSPSNKRSYQGKQEEGKKKEAVIWDEKKDRCLKKSVQNLNDTFSEARDKKYQLSDNVLKVIECAELTRLAG